MVVACLCLRSLLLYLSLLHIPHTMETKKIDMIIVTVIDFGTVADRLISIVVASPLYVDHHPIGGRARPMVSTTRTQVLKATI